MSTPLWRPPDETASVGAEAVLLEWLDATGRCHPANPAGLRDWARHEPAAFGAAFAAFARIDPALADDAAGWLLGAGVRPDDLVMWSGDPAAPCLAALAAIGGLLATQPAQATLRLDRPPVWPPPPNLPPLKSPASGRDEQ